MKAWEAGGVEIDDTLIKNVATTLNGVDLHNILVRGIPKPDWLRTRFVVGDAAKTSAVLGDLLQLVGQRGIPINVRVFPRGIPWPGELLVDLEVAQQRG
jgi:hypothetical protein